MTVWKIMVYNERPSAQILFYHRGIILKWCVCRKPVAITEERNQTMKKLTLLAALTATLSANVQAFDVESKYTQACAACHKMAVAGAPKAFDAEAWAPRLEKGMDTLVQSVTNGLNAMPPRGLCMDCTADQYKALIEYMSTPK